MLSQHKLCVHLLKHRYFKRIAHKRSINNFQAVTDRDRLDELQVILIILEVLHVVRKLVYIVSLPQDIPIYFDVKFCESSSFIKTHSLDRSSLNNFIRLQSVNFLFSQNLWRYLDAGGHDEYQTWWKTLLDDIDEFVNQILTLLLFVFQPKVYDQKPKCNMDDDQVIKKL